MTAKPGIAALLCALLLAATPAHAAGEHVCDKHTTGNAGSCQGSIAWRAGQPTSLMCEVVGRAENASSSVVINCKKACR